MRTLEVEQLHCAGVPHCHHRTVCGATDVFDDASHNSFWQTSTAAGSYDNQVDAVLACILSD